MLKSRARLRSALAVIARRQRSVLLTYPGLRMGNVLYFALQAYIRQAAGRDWVVLDPEPGSEWVAGIPRLESLLVTPQEIRFTDERLFIPELFFQEFGVDFSSAQLTEFITDVLLPARGLGLAAPANQLSQPELTINVRRGDYYSDPNLRSIFGFDVVAYVREAVALDLMQFGRAGRIFVVSDDAGWCRDKLGWLGDVTNHVDFVGPEDGVLVTFARIARSRRLIITNSTFSYWAAYVSNALHGDNHNAVWSPKLHSRDRRKGQPWQLDPRWNQIWIR